MKKRSAIEDAREFARHYFECKNGREAVRRAFPGSRCSDASADTRASRLLKSDEVRRFLDELNAGLDKKAIMSKEERMRWLSQVVQTPVGEVDEGSALCQEVFISEGGDRRFKMPSKVAAIQELNKMDGAYEPEKVEVSGCLSFRNLLGDLPDAPVVKGTQ